MYEGEDDIWDLLRFKDFKATVLGHFMKEAVWMLLDLTVDLLPKGKRSVAADRLSYPKMQGPHNDMAKELLVGGLYYSVVDFTPQAIEMADRQRAFRALPFSGMDSDEKKQECISVLKPTTTSSDSDSDTPLSSSSSSSRSRSSSINLSSSQETVAALDMALSEAQPKSTKLTWRKRIFSCCRRTRNAEAPYAVGVKSDVPAAAQNIRRRPSFASRVASGLSKLFCCCRRQ
ncbi:uncharacterized protein LOC134466234 [Engraulis encrasicolus]|uniref:uncharacterized protein LOC134466234 n=1 Tax=Engraulis encrasicolus TaxID=184585 RepID=UPI002FCE8CC3